MLSKFSQAARQRRNKVSRKNNVSFDQLETLEHRVVLSGAPVGLAAPVIQAEVSSIVPRIVNGQQTAEYESVGSVNGSCTGTLISPTHVLTAAHCVEGQSNSAATFAVNGQTYHSTKIISHPDYSSQNFDAGNDIAVIELDRAVEGVTPSKILRVAPKVGDMLTLVGFGQAGTNSQPDLDNEAKHVGQTAIESITAQHINWKFDGPGESNTAPGDSGGPAFVNVNGELLVAGVTSGGANNAHEVGGESFDTRVDVHATWIDSILNGTNTDPTAPGGTDGSTDGPDFPGGPDGQPGDLDDIFGPGGMDWLDDILNDGCHAPDVDLGDDGLDNGDLGDLDCGNEDGWLEPGGDDGWGELGDEEWDLSTGGDIWGDWGASGWDEPAGNSWSEPGQDDWQDFGGFGWFDDWGY